MKKILPNWRKNLPVALAFLGMYGLAYLSTSDDVQVKAASPSEGVFPDFSMPTISGEAWTLSKQRGHIVLVNFWAPWCPPCREETPDIVRLKEEYGSRGLVIAGLVADPSDPEAIRKFVKQYKINYPVLLPRSDSAIVQAVDLLPTTLLLDSQGKRVKTYVGRLPIPTVRSDLANLLVGR